jgi:hypothetical protein
LKSNLSRKAAGFPLGLKDSSPQGHPDDGKGECLHQKTSAKKLKRYHRIRRNNIDWTVELERGMHRVDAVELPQHLLVPGVWVEEGTTNPLA